MTSLPEDICHGCGANRDRGELCACLPSGNPYNPSNPSGVVVSGRFPDASDGSDGCAEAPGEPLAGILDDLEDFAARYVAWPATSMGVAWALWIAHAYILDEFDSTPRLGVIAPEKQSGKTRVLEVSEAVLPNPKRASDVSVAVLFRLISADQKPVILLDEADAIWAGKGGNEELRSLVNGGHRRGNSVMRMVGEGAAMKATEFDTFAALALAGIGDLPDTVMDRSVLLRMKRRRPSDKVDRWRFRQGREEGHEFRLRLTAWAHTVQDVPDVVDDDLIHDRTFDVWEPLFTVAALAGGDWPSRARQACLELAIDGRVEDYSLRLRAVADLREVWPGDDAWAETGLLILAMQLIPESPWAKDGPLGEHGLTARKLAIYLKHYDVKPHHSPDKSARGYLRAHLADAWDRYLPPAPSAHPSEPSNPSGGGGPVPSGHPSEPSNPSDDGTSGRFGRDVQVSGGQDPDPDPDWQPDYLLNPDEGDEDL